MALAMSQCFAMKAQTSPEESLLRQDTAEVVLPWPVNVQTRLDSLTTDPLLERTQLGLMVYDLSADSVLYSYGGKQTMRPASTMKLLTSVTALDLLGAGYAYRTYLYYKGKIAEGVLSGDVWIVGSMDPLFDETDMRVFAETLHRVGVDTIRGRIIQDTSFKEEQLLGEGWCWDDDNPQLTPLLISRKDEFASQFKDELVKCGVVVEAPISAGRLPRDKDVLLVCSRSHSLNEVLVPMMKESDNLYAESMFFQIAASMGKRPAEAAHAIYVAEGVEDMYKTPYSRGAARDRVSIIKGRRLLSQKMGDTLGIKVAGGPVQAVVMDLVKNRDFLLNKEDLDNYDFRMGLPEYINDRQQYVVLMEPLVITDYALYHGKLYIDAERLAFTRIELDLDMRDKDKATHTMLVKKPFGVRFKPRELSTVVDYRFEDGVTRISYLRNIFRFNCDWKRKLFSTSFTATCEMAVTDSQSDDVKPIANRNSFDSRDAYYDRVEYFMDPEYWRNYNIIEPSESLDKAIKKLVSRYRRN